MPKVRPCAPPAGRPIRHVASDARAAGRALLPQRRRRASLTLGCGIATASPADEEVIARCQGQILKITEPRDRTDTGSMSGRVVRFAGLIHRCRRSSPVELGVCGSHGLLASRNILRRIPVFRPFFRRRRSEEHDRKRRRHGQGNRAVDRRIRKRDDRRSRKPWRLRQKSMRDLAPTRSSAAQGRTPNGAERRSGRRGRTPGQDFSRRADPPGSVAGQGFGGPQAGEHAKGRQRAGRRHR